jgi:hypothetical protein
MDRPGILMPDAAIYIAMILLGLLVVVLLMAPAISRWLDRL